MRLSQIVEGAALTDFIQDAVRRLVAMDEPCWKLAGKLAVALQRRGYDNAAKRVQMAATDENSKALATALQDLLGDKGVFPTGL